MVYRKSSLNIIDNSINISTNLEQYNGITKNIIDMNTADIDVVCKVIIDKIDIYLTTRHKYMYNGYTITKKKLYEIFNYDLKMNMLIQLFKDDKFNIIIDSIKTRIKEYVKNNPPVSIGFDLDKVVEEYVKSMPK